MALERISPWRHLKRPSEVLVVAAALILFAPLLAVIAAAIKIDDRGPVLFTQGRAGKQGRAFTVYKFRTMIVNADDLLDEQGNPTGPRVTRVGKVLRRYSLDELPQLFNVVRGDMALIGPRPVPVEYVDRMTSAQRRRHDVRPGLTGLAQVTDRHGLTWSQRIDLDLEYVDHFSFRMDLTIIRRTARAILSAEVLLDRGDSSKVDLG